MIYPQKHLREVVSLHGTGDATGAIREVLERGLVALEEKKKAERIAERGDDLKKNPHISDAGKCVRAVTYSLQNIEQSDPPTIDALMNFLVGHKIEDAFAQVLEAAGATVLREERVILEHGGTVVTGRKDFSGVQVRWSAKVAEAFGLTVDLPEGAIVELKSINSRAMGFMLKKGDKGRDEHRRQLNLYLAADNQPVGALVYIVKDTTKGEPIAHAFLVERDLAKATADLEQLAGAHETAKRGELAPIPNGNTQNAFPCTYCNFRTRCWLDAAQKEAANA